MKWDVFLVSSTVSDLTENPREVFHDQRREKGRGGEDITKLGEAKKALINKHF